MEKWGDLYLGVVAAFLAVTSLAAVAMTFRGEATRWASIVDHSPIVDLATVFLVIGLLLAWGRSRAK